MADAIEPLILHALTRAAAEPAGRVLVAAKGHDGFFPNSAAGKTAARRACDAGWFAFTADGKTATVTPKGLEHLLAQANPKPILDDFVRVLEARESQVQMLIGTCREMAQQIAALKRVVEAVLPTVTATRALPNRVFPTVATEPDDSGPIVTATRVGVREAILSQLTSFAATAGEDCPLPILFRDLPSPTSVGSFHDNLRALHAEGRIYLHPWTGPLYALPEPGLSLLVGHEVAYYASPASRTA